MSAPARRFARASVLVVCALLLTAQAASSSGRPAPLLGKSWGPNQQGYGFPHPRNVFNGGDPTGAVNNIHWTSWGSARATGAGSAVYDWPGTAVAANRATSGARIVAFHLGTCAGKRSYNAVEWFFPKYGEHFHANRYINTCTGKYVGESLAETHCSDVRFSDGEIAAEVVVIKMSCSAATELIERAPVSRYAGAGGRFIESSFRCGTMGGVGGLDPIFDCQRDEQEFLFNLTPP